MLSREHLVLILNKKSNFLHIKIPHVKVLKQWCVKESVNASKVIQTHNIKWNVESFYQVTICRKKNQSKNPQSLFETNKSQK